MDQQQHQHLTSQVRQNWAMLRHQLLDQFAQVSTSDLDAATDATDLIQRIADKSDYSERFVETRIAELVGVGGGQSGLQSGQMAQSQPFGQAAVGSPQQGAQHGSQRLGSIRE